eukprot:TRINITY_DN7132_c0_g1_i1.p1 TRINITY_DN7132_c0_g1~~TRINITY_DN7132_c0_g1_i1.p1  ORF type:complete len:257 (-),score=72.55 TRINITY_DN7132_c0_g1_i1:35-805(-)
MQDSTRVAASRVQAELSQLQREADHADREARAAQEDALAGQRKLKVVQEQLHSERQRTSVLQQQLDRAAQHARGAEHREKASAAAHQASQQAQLGCESKLRADKEALQRELEGLQAQLVHQRTSNSVDEYQSWKRRLDASLSLSPSVLRVPEECPVASAQGAEGQGHTNMSTWARYVRSAQSRCGHRAEGGQASDLWCSERPTPCEHSGEYRGEFSSEADFGNEFVVCQGGNGSMGDGGKLRTVPIKISIRPVPRG